MTAALLPSTRSPLPFPQHNNFYIAEFLAALLWGAALRLSKKLFYRKQRKSREKKISTRISSRTSCACLLFPFLHSGVPSYADECKNEKYTYLFRCLSACRDFLDTLSRAPLGRGFFVAFVILLGVGKYNAVGSFAP